MTEQALQSPSSVNANHLGSTGFDSIKQLVSMGESTLNQTGRGLTDLDSRLMVEVAIAPLSEAEIFRKDAWDLAVWLHVIRNIRSIDDSHGFHWNGRLIKGADIFDHAEGESGHSLAYHTERSSLIRSIAMQVLATGEEQYIPLTLMTPELLRGHALPVPQMYKTVFNNLRDRRASLNERIASQTRSDTLGQIIAQNNPNDPTGQQLSAEEYIGSRLRIHKIHMHTGNGYWARKNQDRLPARPAALRLFIR